MENLKPDESAGTALSAEEIEFFQREGYLVLPGLIEPEHNTRLTAEVDDMVGHRAAGDHRMLVTYREMGLLTSHPPAIAAVASLMGGSLFTMHHIHSNRFDEGASGVGWHQDYEQHPQCNRSHLMVHVFYYLNGLNGEIGDLLIPAAVAQPRGAAGPENAGNRGPGGVALLRRPRARVGGRRALRGLARAPPQTGRPGAAPFISSTSRIARTGCSGPPTTPPAESTPGRWKPGSTATGATPSSTTARSSTTTAPYPNASGEINQGSLVTKLALPDTG